MPNIFIHVFLFTVLWWIVCALCALDYTFGKCLDYCNLGLYFDCKWLLKAYLELRPHEKQASCTDWQQDIPLHQLLHHLKWKLWKVIVIPKYNYIGLILTFLLIWPPHGWFKKITSPMWLFNRPSWITILNIVKFYPSVGLVNLVVTSPDNTFRKITSLRLMD